MRSGSSAVPHRGAVGAVLLRAGAQSFVVTAASAGLAVLVQMGLSRVLGVREFGRYAYVLGWVNLLALLGTLGFESAALRFVAQYRVEGEIAALRGFLTRATMVGLGAGVIAGLGLLAFGAAAWPQREALAGTLAWGTALLPLLVLMRLCVAYLLGLRHVVLGAAIQGAGRSLLHGALVLIAWRFGGEVSAEGAMRLNWWASAPALTVLLVALWSSLPASLWSTAPLFLTASWFRTSGPLLAISAAQALLLSTDTLMLGWLRGTDEAGMYSVAAQLVSVITLGITAANAVVAPMIAELHALADRSGLRRLLALSARGVLAYALPVVAMLALFGRDLLRLYGPAFEASWGPMMILAVGQLAIVAFGSVGFLLTMSGRERAASVAIVGSAVANLILNGLLIPRWGAVGAAAATAIATTGRSAILTVWAWRHLGLTATAFGGR